MSIKIDVSISFTGFLQVFNMADRFLKIRKLLGKGAIRRASFDPNQFLSNLFTIPKKGGRLRPVINLKPLNHFVEYHHFKMEGLSSLLDLIRRNDYMITMDLKDAYLPVPIHADHSNYLRFLNGNQSYGNSLVFSLGCRRPLEYLLK